MVMQDLYPLDTVYSYTPIGHNPRIWVSMVMQDLYPIDTIYSYTPIGHNPRIWVSRIMQDLVSATVWDSRSLGGSSAW